MGVLISKQNEGQKYRIRCDTILENPLHRNLDILYRPQYKNEKGDWVYYMNIHDQKDSEEVQFYDYDKALDFIKERIQDKNNQDNSIYLYIREAQ